MKIRKKDRIEAMNNNVIIAKYMGINPLKGTAYNGDTYYYFNCDIMKDYEALPDYRDYSYLMEVVEKINIIDSVIIYPKCCKIISTFKDFKDIETEGDTRMSIFNSVLTYIKTKNVKED